MVQRPRAVRSGSRARGQQRRERHGAGVEGSHHVGVHAAHAQPAHACKGSGEGRALVWFTESDAH